MGTGVISFLPCAPASYCAAFFKAVVVLLWPEERLHLAAVVLQALQLHELVHADVAAGANAGMAALRQTAGMGVC
jgi:hypothetical protein